MVQSLLRRASLAAFLVAASSLSFSQTYVQTDFQSFANGPLDGQQGWAAESTKWTIGAFGEDGGKALKVDSSWATAGSQWAYYTFPANYNAATTPNKVFVVRARMKVPSNGTSRYGLECYTPTFDLVGGVMITAGTGAIRVDTDLFPYFPTMTAPLDAWFTLEVVYDFTTQSMNAKINGTPVSTTGYDFDSVQGVISDADIRSTRPNSAATGIGYFDDFYAGAPSSSLPGDIDHDGDVDIDDYDLLAYAYGTFVGDAAYNPDADLDNDGDVDIDDYDILANNYGRFQS